MRHIALIAIVPVLMTYESIAAAQEPTPSQRPTAATPIEAPIPSTEPRLQPSADPVLASPLATQANSTHAPLVLSRPTTVAEYDRVIAEHLSRANRSSGAERAAEMATVRKLWEWHREDVGVRSTGMVIGGLAIAFLGVAGAVTGGIFLQKSDGLVSYPNEVGAAILIPSLAVVVGGVVLTVIGIRPVIRRPASPAASISPLIFSF